MANEQKQDLIRKALTMNVNLSEKDYAELCRKADTATKNSGAKGTAPVTESTRARRIAMNYYGVATNILLNTMVGQEELRGIAQEILAELKTLTLLLSKAFGIEIADAPKAESVEAEGEEEKA